MNNNDKKEEAIRLIKKGIGVIPLQNPEEPIRFNGESDEDFGKRRKSELDRRKQPALAWTPYKTKLATIDEVNNWFSFNANYNLAIPCGDVSGGLIAFDVDGDTAKKWIEDKFPTMSEGLRKALNNTMRNVTGSGGQHFVFYVEGGKTDISQITIWRNDEKHSEIKIQGNYHYIATAPSRSPHNNGKLYESNGKDPVIITKEQLDEFIQAIGLPELVNNNNKNNNNNKKLSDPATTTSETNSSSSNSNQVMAELEEGGSRSLTPEQMQQLLQEVIPCYTPGGRNEIMYCLPGAMRKEGLRLETAEKFATLLSEEAGDTSEELRRSLDKVDRTYSQPIDELNGKKGLYEYLSSAFGQEGRERFTRICQIINNPDVLRNALVEAVKEEKRRRWEDGTDAGGGGNGENGEAQQTTDEEEDNSPGAWLSKKKQVDPHLDVVATICEEVLHREKFKTYADTKEIVVYRDGIYIPDGENVVEQLIDLLANYDITQHKINEIFRNVRVKTLTDRSLFDAIPNIITVENGLLDIFTWELKPHRPGFLSTTKYPMKYETEAECPITEQFLADTIQDPFKIREFLKFWGYVLTKDCKYEKAVMFVGTGANGKGILIRLMEAQEGGFDKCSHVSLHHMGEDRFATAGLYGKTLNTFADLEGDKLKSTGNLKTIISGDSVEGQH